MDYSTNQNQVVFLKDADIVQNVGGTNKAGEDVLSNGVASFDFAFGISSTASAAIDAVNGRCDTIAEDLANGLLSVNDLISNETSGLNVKLEAETTARSNQTQFLSTKISDDISAAIDDLNTNLATSASNLTTAVEAIRADVKGGVNYKGHLKLDVFTSPQDLSTYVSFLHGGTYSGDTITIPDAVKATELNNGWMYYISMSDGTTDYTTNDGIKFVPGNYIIVHAHNAAGDAADLSSVTLSDLTRDNIDIIQVTDSDIVRISQLTQTSGNLTGLIATTKTELNGNIDSAKEWVENTVSNSLSTDYVSKIGAVATDLAEAKQKYDAICVGLSTNLRDLSTDVTGDISSEVHNKVTLSAFGNSAISAIENLKLVKMTAAQYAAVDAADKEAGDKIYCITDADINAYGNKVVSVAVPTDALDAANKQYVDAASAYVDGEVAQLRNDAANAYVVSANAKAATLSVQGNTYLSNVVACNDLTAHEITIDAVSATDGKCTNLTAKMLNCTDTFNLNDGEVRHISAATISADAISSLNATTVDAKTTNLTVENELRVYKSTTNSADITSINAIGLKVSNNQFALSTGDTAINITTQAGLEDVRVNGVSLQNTLATLSNDSVVSAKTYSDTLSNAVSTTTNAQIAAALTDAKDYTDDLSDAVDGKFTATSTYINTQDTAASANAYAQVKADLTSELDSSNHLKLYIGDKTFADYKLHNVLQSAALSDVGGQKAIVFTWNTASGVENTTSVLVQDLIDTYNAEGTYIKLSSDSTTFYLDFNLLSNALGVGGLSSRATTLETSATNFNGRIGVLESDNTTNKGNIQSLSTALTAASTGINAQLTTHDARITTNSNSINSINSQIGSILTGSTNSISSIINRLDTIIDPAISQNATDIATNTGSINAIKSFLSVGSNSIDAKVASNSDTIADILVDVGSLQTSVDTINTNLATTTAKADAYASVSATYVTTTALNTALGSYETTADLTTNYYNKTAADAVFATKANTYLKGETSSSIEINNAFNAISNTYYTKEVADEKFATASEITGTLSAYYSKVDADAVFETQTHAAQTYATIANADAKYAEIAHTSSDTQLTAEFAKYQLTANMSAYQLTSDMSDYIPLSDNGDYQKVSDMSDYLSTSVAEATYETTANVEQLISNMKNGISDITAEVEMLSDGTQLTGQSTDDVAVLSAKIDELVTNMNIIFNMLSGISKNAPEPEVEPEAE